MKEDKQEDKQEDNKVDEKAGIFISEHIKIYDLGTNETYINQRGDHIK